VFKSRPELLLRSSVTPFCDAMTAASFPRAEAGRFSRTWSAASPRPPDGAHQITTAFTTSLETAQLRANSLFKVDTLLGALHRFRDGLAAEAEPAEQREQRRR
jgi:hypothetical protein